MLSGQELPHYTYDDFKLWEGAWELIAGIPYAMTPTPSYRHQRISQIIARLLDEGLDDCESCHALLPVDWIVADDTIVEPDNMVICYQPKGKFLTKAPSIIFEILSPSTATKDRTTKYSIYEHEGVKYYCIVDPENSVAKVYLLQEGRYIKQLDATDEVFTFDVAKCQFNFDFSRIWAE